MRILGIIIACFIHISVWAQDVTFHASAPTVVEVGEQFRLTFSVNKDGDNFTPPQMEGFDVMGPSTSSSTSVQIINGKMTRSSDYSYTYVLTAQKEGTFTIPSASITVKGKTLQSNTLTIKVVKGQTRNARPAVQDKGEDEEYEEDDVRQEPTPRGVNNDNLFVRIQLSKNSLYLGESLVATLKVYTKVDLTNLGRIKFPSFEGFLSEELSSGNISLEREEYNGQIYHVGVIRKLLLYPQHTGKLTIEPFELECLVRQQVSGGGRRSIFDDFFNDYQEMRVQRVSKPVEVTVKELPSVGKPIEFSGIVGNINMSSTISSDTVQANNALTYTLTFRGDGNIKLLQAPKLDLPTDFESYEPKVTPNIQISQEGMSGSVKVEYLIIPRYAGTYTIPAVNFSYFDTRSNTYRTLKGQDFEIRVSKDNNAGAAGGAVGIQSFKKEDIRTVGQDIRYIKTGNLKLRDKQIKYYGTFTHWMSFIVLFVVFVIAVIINRRRIKENADIAKVKNKSANKMAKRRMKLAASALKQNNSNQFFEEVLKALWGYISYKMNIDVADLNRDNISELLAKRQVEEQTIAEFIGVLDETEYARYAPGKDKDAEMHSIYQKSIDIITLLDKSIK